MEQETYLIVGLGNPGLNYAHTRHNVGFDVTDILARRWNAPMDRERLNGRLAELRRGEKRVVLCQPLTFMNLSGECCAKLLNWYKCPRDHMLVIYDDIDLPTARLRLRKAGGAGTHNGMESIVNLVGGKDFPRLRVGTGAQPAGWDLADWVLSRYQTREEQQAMDEAFEKAADITELWLDKGVDEAMQICNRK